jgi:hypothetical protein
MVATYKGINYPDKSDPMVTSNISYNKISSVGSENFLTGTNVPIHVADETERETLYNFPGDGFAVWREDIGSEQRFNNDAWYGVNTGLMTIRPTDVVFALGVGGSGSVGETGLITFNAATGIFVNGIFGPAFKNYKVILRVRTSVAAFGNIFFQFASGGVNDGTSSYIFTDMYTAGSTFNGIQQTTTNGNISYGAANAVSTLADITFYNPYLGKPNWSSSAVAHSATVSAPTLIETSGYFNSSSVAFDGFRISSTSGTALTGTMLIMGFN